MDGRSLLMTSLLSACSAQEGERADPVPADSGGADTGDSAIPSEDCSADEQTLRALFESASPSASEVEQALSQLAMSCGLPLQSSSGSWLFACACGDGQWQLAGDFNDWQGQTMNQNGALHWLELDIESPTDAGYKFTDGAQAWEADPWARRYLYDQNGELSLVQAQQAHLERWPAVEGQGLRSRALRIWVPAGGIFDRVLYAHDGQNLFDPQGMWGGWQLQDSLPDGILVAGIDNTADRMEEYTHVEDFLHGAWYGGWGDAYAALVQEQVRGLVEERYGQAEVNGLLGSSLGGLISLHIAGQYEGSYDFAACMSGTLGWGSFGATNQTMIERYAAAGHRSTAIYLDSGGEGTCWDSDGDGIQDDDPDASDNYCETLQMADTLEGLGYQYEQDLWHWWEQGAEHNEVAWGSRVWLPLSVFAEL